MDYDGRDDQTTFAVKLKDVHLPDYGSKDQNFREFQSIEGQITNPSIERLAINQIVNESYLSDKEKTIPVQHFLIDYRYMILGNTIRNNLDDSKTKE
jgi:hypothetical protein